ncbi:hypothetical protein [Pseudobacter ginsenosidimutans]|nr:hypothetical protein [Pseudobacter ginsenosidimutans]QEC43932.1 hypothetical protein FSB84_20450 [Pseudobacter ginsenosidimutans]
MKKIMLYLLLLVSSGMLLSFSYVYYRFNEVLKSLDLTDERAQRYVLENLESGGFSAPVTAAAMAIPVGKRADIVNKLGDYVKAYVNSPAFKKQYQEKRDAWNIRSWDDLIDEQIQQELKDIEEDLENAPSVIANASAAMKPVYEKGLKETKERKAALIDPKHPKHAQYRRESEADLMEREDKQAFMENYKNEMADLEKKLPADFNVLLRKRLREFLQETANIPWDAKLEKKGRKMVFTDPELEKKSFAWKARFRSGKEVVEAARSYAQSWLKALPAK